MLLLPGETWGIWQGKQVREVEAPGVLTLCSPEQPASGPSAPLPPQHVLGGGATSIQNNCGCNFSCDPPVASSVSFSETT